MREYQIYRMDQWYIPLDDTGSGPGRCVTQSDAFAEISRNTGMPVLPALTKIRTPDDYIMSERYLGYQAEDVTYKYSDLANRISKLGPGQLRVVHVSGSPKGHYVYQRLCHLRNFPGNSLSGKAK